MMPPLTFEDPNEALLHLGLGGVRGSKFVLLRHWSVNVGVKRAHWQRGQKVVFLACG